MRTEKAYCAWIRRFIIFHGKRHPNELRDNGPPGIIAIIELQGDFVGIDLDPTSKSFSRLIDWAGEETWGVVASCAC